MDKKIAGLAGAISSLAAMQAADALPAQGITDITNPRSYAELLQPIPNAAALLKAVDAESAARAAAKAKRNPNVRLTQYWGDDGYPDYHHHHHHNNYYYPYYPPYYDHHHHHHHHHNQYYDGWED